MEFSSYARRYGISPANPKGVRPDFTKCAADVSARGGWSLAASNQCKRPCGHGPNGAFCKQHAKEFRD